MSVFPVINTSKPQHLVNCLTCAMLSLSLLETLNKVSASQDVLVAEVKGMRQELEGLMRRITSLSSRQQQHQQQQRERTADGGLLSLQSWSSIVVAIVLYSFIKWLAERFWS